MSRSADRPGLPRASADGPLFAEKYRLISPIAAGGSGIVWRARHLTLGVDVAIKLLRTAAMSGEARARFEREARLAALASTRTSHVVQVSDFGIVDDGTPYIVMELVEGESLADRIARGRLSWREVVTIGLQLCEALEVVHHAGIVHRDVKPSNVLIRRHPNGPEAKLLDFGVAKRLGVDGISVRRMPIGTPRYMSPEQRAGLPAVDARSDLWSLAAVLFEALTGRPPFEGEHDEGPPILPPAVAAQVPGELFVILERGLRLERERRFLSARAFADALGAVGSDVDARAPDRRISDRPSDAIGALYRDPLVVEPPRRRTRWAVAVLGCALLLVAVIARLGRAPENAPKAAAARPAPSPSVTPSASTSASARTPR
jgi:serine/threonine-protein kinase